LEFTRFEYGLLIPHASEVDDGSNQQDYCYDPEERDEKHFPSPEKV